MPKTIMLDKGEWCYADCDGLTKHGQHYKTYGACGYVNFRLFDSVIADLARRKYEGKNHG
jgi:hypothetical protein